MAGSGPAPPGYPSHREADIALRDGSTVRVRPLRPDDEGALRAFLEGLSPESQLLRFFSGGVSLARQARIAAQVDYRDTYGVIATTGPEGRVVAHAQYARSDGDRAEVAFAIADAFQGKGIATTMLAHLSEAAGEAGIARFEAQVLPENHRMLEVFRQSGFPTRTRRDDGVVVVEFPTSLSPTALERFELRDRTAAVAALRRFLSPRSVAVIGASRRRGTVGGEIFHNLLEAGFNGPVYPVNAAADTVQSVVAYPTVLHVPGEVDLAVVVVPAARVCEAARQCAAKGVAGLVVISSGFAEAGKRGAELQDELLAICRGSGMRLIGPNTMGVLNTDPEVSLNAQFGPVFPPRGRVGFLSQSGALGLAVIDHAARLGLGLSSFVSVGNKADISGNDLIQYWEEDPDTDVMLLYLESFGNPRRFARIARRAAKSKPIVAVKGGRSTAGARAAASHTGALIAASDVTVDALFRQTGVIRTDTLGELFDVAALLAHAPAPRGRRVAIVTNAGGPGILCADACEAEGLEVVALPEDVRASLRRAVPAAASVANPVDLLATASPDDYSRSVSIVAESGAVHALIAIFIQPLQTPAEEVGRALEQSVAAIGERLPVLAVLMSEAGGAQPRGMGAGAFPVYSFPEDAARALARVVGYGEWLERPEGERPDLSDARPEQGAEVIAAGVSDGGRWLHPDELATLLSCYGLSLPRSRVVGSPQEAGRFAAELGVPVAVKAVAPTLVHKTEAGGVRLGLVGEQAAREAADAVAEGVRAAGHELAGFLVQEMVGEGVEMLVGVVHDPLFGPVVACGAGGTAAELLHDVAVRITPLTDVDAREMPRSLRTFPLLDGYRGAPKMNVAALEQLLLRVGAMVENHPEIAEMDLNPVIVSPERAAVVDARVRVAEPAPRAPWPSLARP